MKRRTISLSLPRYYIYKYGIYFSRELDTNRRRRPVLFSKWNKNVDEKKAKEKKMIIKTPLRIKVAIY